MEKKFREVSKKMVAKAKNKPLAKEFVDYVLARGIKSKKQLAFDALNLAKICG